MSISAKVKENVSLYDIPVLEKYEMKKKKYRKLNLFCTNKRKKTSDI